MEGHPLVTWYATLRRADAARVDLVEIEVDGNKVDGTDVVLGDLGGRRFGLSVTKDGEPLLCCLGDDVAAIRSVPWTSAAMAFGFKGRDWIALSCKDARVKGSSEMNPAPIRLWIPISTGRLDAWRDVAPRRVLVAAMASGRGKEARVDGAPFAELPMKMIGKPIGQ